MGQLKAGDRVRFVPLTDDEAARLDAQRRASTRPGAGVERARRESPRGSRRSSTRRGSGASADDAIVYRRDGDDYLLVEYGPPVLDLALRLRVHALMQALEAHAVDGIVDLTPGIRSLPDPLRPGRALRRAKLLALLQRRRARPAARSTRW